MCPLHFPNAQIFLEWFREAAWMPAAAASRAVIPLLSAFQLYRRVSIMIAWNWQLSAWSHVHNAIQPNAYSQDIWDKRASTLTTAQVQGIPFYNFLLAVQVQHCTYINSPIYSTATPRKHILLTVMEYNVQKSFSLHGILQASAVLKNSWQTWNKCIFGHSGLLHSKTKNIVS